MLELNLGGFLNDDYLFMNEITFQFGRFQALPEKVQKLLKDRVQKSGEFSRLRTLHLQDDLHTYSQQNKTILCPGDMETVWKCYTRRRPDETWTGPLVNFLFAYSERSKQFFYPDDQHMPLFHEGMQCYCWLNLWGPRLIIGLKVLRMDQSAKSLEIAYIEGGLYRGTQILSFIPENSQTRIRHLSYYKSKSMLMDMTLYPFFHNWTVGEHHKNMALELERIKKDLSASS